jgi:ferredoxin
MPNGKEVKWMTAHVNENCIGCGLCTGISPDVFTMTDEGTAAARDEIFPEQEPQVQEAAESCPVNAIEVN